MHEQVDVHALDPTVNDAYVGTYDCVCGHPVELQRGGPHGHVWLDGTLNDDHVVDACPGCGADLDATAALLTPIGASPGLGAPARAA